MCYYYIKVTLSNFYISVLKDLNNIYGSIRNENLIFEPDMFRSKIGGGLSSDSTTDDEQFNKLRETCVDILNQLRSL